MEIGRQIAALRKARGITQEQLAAKLSVSPQAVSKWETGKGMPDIELLPELACSLDTDLDALLGYKTRKLVTSVYEQKYKSDEYYWGNQVWEGCYDALKIMPPTRPLRLLDIGCGEGQAAVFFAKNGYTVSAYDVSGNGVKKGMELADISGVSVDFFQADMLEYHLENEFDIIYCSGALQYLPRERRKGFIDNLKEHTEENGIHVLNVFVEKPFLLPPPDWEEGEHFWHSGELFGYYHDWKLELLKEVIFDCSSSGIPHKHCMDVLIARKYTRTGDSGKGKVGEEEGKSDVGRKQGAKE